MLDNVDKSLLPIKAHYFFFNAATGPIVPFLPTIAKQLGFSSSLVGTIYTVLPISGLVAKPFFGGLADKFNLPKTFFLLFQVLLIISLFSIHFIPQPDASTNVTFTCQGDLFLEVRSKEGFSTDVLNSIITNKETINNPTCQLSCKASKRAYEELCPWNSKYCVTNASNILPNETFDLKATINMFKDLPVDEHFTTLKISNLTFSNGITHVPACKKLLQTSCLATCHHPALNELLRESDNYNEHTTPSSHQFHLFLWAATASWVCMAVIVSIADSICFNLLGNERRSDYGKQRMWGSIGFGIFGIAAGYLVDVFSEGQFQKDYTCIFFIMLIFMILDLMVSSTLRKKNPECSDEPSMLKELLTVAKEPNVWIFAWWCIGAGMCTGVVWNFLFWHTENLATISQTKWLKTLQGLLTGIQCFLAELPFNFLSGTILKKLGHINVMSLVLLIYSIRFMAYSVITNPWLFLPLEIFHGPSFGLCWPTMVSYGDKVTPPGTQATIQGLIGAIFEGIGASSGTLLCGWIMDVYGGVITFRVFSVGALVWLSIFWLMQLILRKLYTSQRCHNHLVSYANPDDAILMTISQELQTY